MADFGFHQYRDLFSTIRRHDNLPRDLATVKRTYKEFVEVSFRTQQPGILLHQCAAEGDWYEAGQPYFKIWPSMIGALSHINLNLNCNLLRTPYASLEIRFPITNNSMRESANSPELRAILASIAEVDNNRILSIWMDFGETTNMVDPKYDEPVLTFLRFELLENKTIKQAVDGRPPDMPLMDGYFPSHKFQMAALQLAIAVMFFAADQHEIVAPDLPKKLVDKYTSARKSGNKREMDEVLKKARKRLQLPEYTAGGFVIGREIDLPRRTIRDFKDAKPGDGERHWEISYGYVRSAHVRMQPFGPKSNPQVEAILISATPVRPDLPMKQPGFNIK